VNSYSYYFHTLFDQSGPVGYLPNGAHHSVLRSLNWFAPDGSLLAEPTFHDFAIIWDEDHDTRLLPVLEHLYRARLLYKALFVGEAKGVLSVVVDSEPRDLKSYTKAVEVIAQANEDPWNCEVTRFRREVRDSDPPLQGFMVGIHATWRLGIKSSISENRPSSLPGAVPSINRLLTAREALEAVTLDPMKSYVAIENGSVRQFKHSDFRPIQSPAIHGGVIFTSRSRQSMQGG
jgi:hypothetical protein